jgi:ABC-type multidrug transport system ATPase subunit
MTRLADDRVILLSTHIVADLGSGCSDLALLDRGRVAFRGSPTELVALAAGKVVEVDLDDSANAEFGNGLEIVQQYTVDGGTRLRGVLKNGSLPNTRVVSNVTLEEAYLAFMVDRGRNIEELDMTENDSEGEGHS